jgi:hypothetical protein
MPAALMIGRHFLNLGLLQGAERLRRQLLARWNFFSLVGNA